ncbi:MAG TPA: hypothetical protein VFR87_04420 [Nocardioidaceae bacterium]|nr:hypothetical protein [Nocardioidaceae bacterium]
MPGHHHLGLALVAVVLVLAGVWGADGSGRSITAPPGRPGLRDLRAVPGARHGDGPPPYEQVRAQLAGLIRAGALRPGDKLPV